MHIMMVTAARAVASWYKLQCGVRSKDVLFNKKTRRRQLRELFPYKSAGDGKQQLARSRFLPHRSAGGDKIAIVHITAESETIFN